MKTLRVKDEDDQAKGEERFLFQKISARGLSLPLLLMRDAGSYDWSKK